MLVAVNQAKAAGASGLNKRMLPGYRRRYDRLISEGVKLNPCRRRPAIAGDQPRARSAPCSGVWMTTGKEVLRFGSDFRVR